MIRIPTEKKEYFVKEDRCPICGDNQNSGIIIGFELRKGAPEGMQPKDPFPGAWALCSHCGEALVYDEAMDLVLPSDQKTASLTHEQAQFLEDQQIQIRSQN